jgi:hypothetical protein
MANVFTNLYIFPYNYFGGNMGLHLPEPEQGMSALCVRKMCLWFRVCYIYNMLLLLCTKQCSPRPAR